jgi:hypothetical protein
VDNGTEFVNDTLIQYCLSHGIELSQSRPYRKNDQAWIEQKNGAVVRRLLGYRRFAGIGAAKAITRLYGASRLFVNFFQPSFKLASKHREGAHVSKRYHPPQTPCERLLQADLPESAKIQLHRVASALDPLKLLEEIRAMQAHLIALAEGETPPTPTAEPPDLTAFIAGLSSAWRAGEVRPTFSSEAKPRYLRSLQKVAQPVHAQTQVRPPAAVLAAPAITAPARPQVVYAASGTADYRALRKVWPIACRRLEELPTINSTQLFEELCLQFPGKFTARQYSSLNRRIKRWRQNARARGVVIEHLKHRRLTDKPRGKVTHMFTEHWTEMVACLEAQPDQTALELLVEFQARYPDRYHLRNLSALYRRVRVWRREATQRLIYDINGDIADVAAAVDRRW